MGKLKTLISLFLPLAQFIHHADVIFYGPIIIIIIVFPELFMRIKSSFAYELMYACTIANDCVCRSRH